MLCPRCRAHSVLQAAIRRRHHTHSPAWHAPIASSDELTHLKSTFQAYVTLMPTGNLPEQQQIPAAMKGDVLPTLLSHLQDVEPRTRRASHDMYTWRTCPSTSSSSAIYGSSNGGEAGAGERLERLLELGNCENVILVVFRWYGGVKLGSDRWRCISSVAKEALERGGFLTGPKAAAGATGREQVKTGKRRR
ncbi:hypothetical protein C8Q80DRAFT_599831 [Daedaleopsis nitida]|nr:hypothetical protein C8Q80DRAFT_599831 [Daedaleopsis nitida]